MTLDLMRNEIRLTLDLMRNLICHNIGETFEYIVAIYRAFGSSATLRGPNLKRAL